MRQYWEDRAAHRRCMFNDYGFFDLCISRTARIRRSKLHHRQQRRQARSDNCSICITGEFFVIRPCWSTFVLQFNCSSKRGVHEEKLLIRSKIRLLPSCTGGSLLLWTLSQVSKGSLRLSCTTLQKLLQMKNEVIPSSPRRQSTVGAEHKTKPEPSNHSRTSPLLHPLKITRCT